ncbi:MAG: MFS transporter, partial [Calditrichales bacterium]
MTAHAGNDVNVNRLFWGSNFALIATAVTFAIVGAIMGPLKEAFVLTNAEVGWIGGAALWGFAISIFIFGPLCDVLGMKFLLRMALVSHAIGVIVMILADGFTMLFIGALILALGNGLVEAACNPLVATLYPDNKTEMLNRFHVWFPGGIAIGGLISFGLDNIGILSWQVKLGVILIPTIIYGVLFLGQNFPATERLQSGVTGGEMVRATLMRPLFWILFVAMMMTASIELGPNRWIPAVLESAGIHGILVLVWINLLMAIMRYKAGVVVHRLSPTGILFLSAIISGIGLFWLSYTETLGMAIAAGTVFAIGVCYFWPTMLGVTSERIPKGGALALALMGGIGTTIVGLVTSPLMGQVADDYLHERLPLNETTVVMRQIVDTYPALQAEGGEKTAADFEHAIAAAQSVLDEAGKNNALPEIETANALRSAMAVAPTSDAAANAKKILGPAENYGGKISFR